MTDSAPAPLPAVPAGGGPHGAAEWALIRGSHHLTPMPGGEEAVAAPAPIKAKLDELARLRAGLSAAQGALRIAEQKLKSADDSDIARSVEALRAGKPDPGPVNRRTALSDLEDARRRVEVALRAATACQSEVSSLLTEHGPAWARALDQQWSAAGRRAAKLLDDVEAVMAERARLGLLYQFLERGQGAVATSARPPLAGLLDQLRQDAARE